MTTGQKIYECRRKAGMTQEELADRLGVSRQAVSKWESDIAFPETEKILELCKLFQLSADELLFGGNGYGNAEEQSAPQAQIPDATVEKEQAAHEDGAVWGKIDHGKELHYEYVSKLRVCGVPLLHVNFGLGLYRAKGIIAVGNIATGLISWGFLSVGLLAMGFLSVGLLAFGGIALGLLVGAGGVATGVLAFGGVAIGVLTFGGCSVGYIAIGGAAIGQYAMGDWAHGFVAVGKSYVTGTHVFLVPEMLGELYEYIDANVGVFPGGLVKAVAQTLSFSH